MLSLELRHTVAGRVRAMGLRLWKRVELVFVSELGYGSGWCQGLGFWYEVRVGVRVMVREKGSSSGIKLELE